MLDEDPARTTREVLEAVRSAGVRALVARGWAGLGGESLPPEVLAIGPVSHGALLPRVRAMVHHGGAGTIHAAARAGIPLVVVPHLLDQYYETARLIHRPVLPEDAGVIQRLAGDREVAANAAGIPHPFEEGMAEAWLASLDARSHVLALCHAESGAVIVELFILERGHFHANHG